MSRIRRADRVLPPYARWLEKHYVAWQLQQGQRMKVKVFAEFLEISYAHLSHYLNGQGAPGQVVADRIAVKLGYDFEGHDLLGLLRPDLNWLRLAQHWPHLFVEAQADLALQAERLAHQELP